LWNGESTPLFKDMPGEDDSPVRNFKFLFATENTETTERYWFKRQKENIKG